MSERAYLRLHHDFKHSIHKMEGGGYLDVNERIDILDAAESFTMSDRDLIEDIGTGLTWRDEFDGGAIGALWTIAGIKAFVAAVRDKPPVTDSDAEQLITDLMRVVELFELGEVDNHGDPDDPAVWFDVL